MPDQHRHHPPPARRDAEGRSRREILRRLKRDIARAVYHALRAGLASARPDRQTAWGARQTSAPCGPAGAAGPFLDARLPRANGTVYVTSRAT